MSTRRNTGSTPTRSRHIARVGPALGLATFGVALVAVAACSDATDPVSPAGASAARASIAPADKAAEDAARKAAEAALKAAHDSAEAAKKAGRDLAKAELDSLKNDWNAYKQAIQHGAKAEILRCEPQPEMSVSKKIGAKGGSFHIGPHTFEVPAGALDTDVVITGTAPTRSVRELQFAPHGLQFKKPVSMTINYKGCIAPDSATLGVVYVGQGWQVLDRMPAHQEKAANTITALTDHFSGYMVSWGRQ